VSDSFEVQGFNDTNVQTWKASKTNETNVRSLERLIDEQGIKPIDDLDAVGALWPSNDDPESFERFVSLNRKERRQHTQCSEPDSPDSAFSPEP
jgi:hypothetical protein